MDSFDFCFACFSTNVVGVYFVVFFWKRRNRVKITDDLYKATTLERQTSCLLIYRVMIIFFAFSKIVVKYIVHQTYHLSHFDCT